MLDNNYNYNNNNSNYNNGNNKINNKNYSNNKNNDKNKMMIFISQSVSPSHNQHYPSTQQQQLTPQSRTQVPSKVSI